MREAEIVSHRHLALLLTVLVASVSSIACKSDEAASEPESKDSKDSKDLKSQAASEPEPAPTLEPESATPPATNDPQHADKLADLDALCEALDHDYIDGTLSDYYRDVEPRTDWGKAQRDAGNQAMQPGRLLEKAVAELAPHAKDPGLEHCRKLLDYLDDVE